jgi:hypothetical protein
MITQVIQRCLVLTNVLRDGFHVRDAFSQLSRLNSQRRELLLTMAWQARFELRLLPNNLEQHNDSI